MIVGIVGAVLMVGLGKLLGFYSESQALAAVDFNTLGLLLGMMILVALLEPTGFFQYLAVWAGKVSRGRPVRLLVLLGYRYDRSFDVSRQRYDDRVDRTGDHLDM